MSSVETVSCVRRLGGVGVGRADVGEVAPGQDEEHAAVDRAGEDDRVAVVEPAPVHDDVDALGGLQQRRRARVLEQPHPVGPGPGGVDHDAGPEHGLRAAEPVLELRAHHAAGGALERPDGGIVGHQRAVVDGRADGRQREPRVVALGVVEARAAEQSALPQHRLRLQQGALAQHAVRPHIAEQGQRVVQPHAGRQPPERDPVAAVQGKDERQRPDEVRRDAQQDAPLAVGLEHQAQIAGLEVAEAAVHQPAGARAGARAEDARRISSPHRRRDGNPHAPAMDEALMTCPWVFRSLNLFAAA